MSYISPIDRLSISQISTPSWSFEQDALHYAEAGINGIGVWRNKLDALGIPEALAAMDKHGLKCANLVGQIPLAGRMHHLDEELIREGLTLLNVAHTLRTQVVVSIPWDMHGRSPELMRALTMETLQALSPTAKRFGLTIALEPVRSPYVDYFHSMQEALSIATEMDSQSVGVMLDTWHVWDEPGLEYMIRDGIQHISAVQFSGYRVPTRFHNDRLLPGDGAAPNAQIFHWLEDAGFQGWYDLELFSEDIWKMPHEHVLQATRFWFDSVWS